MTQNTHSNNSLEGLTIAVVVVLDDGSLQTIIAQQQKAACGLTQMTKPFTNHFATSTAAISLYGEA